MISFLNVNDMRSSVLETLEASIHAIHVKEEGTTEMRGAEVPRRASAMAVVIGSGTRGTAAGRASGGGGDKRNHNTTQPGASNSTRQAPVGWPMGRSLATNAGARVCTKAMHVRAVCEAHGRPQAQQLSGWEIPVIPLRKITI